MKYNIRFYTDGSCKGNPGVGGYAFVVVEPPYEDYEFIFSKAIHHETTNNRMEMMAFYDALKFFDEMYGEETDVMYIYSDSALICNTLNKLWYKKWEKNGWKTAKREPVANQDLWQLILPLYKKIDPTIKHVKGHNGDRFNELADKFAQNPTGKLEQRNF